MLPPSGKLLWIYLCSVIGYQTAAAPAEYDIMGTDRESNYDFDTEQSKARYDSRLLSEALQEHHSSSQKRSTPCYTANTKYDHGQKVMRADPCEMCLCVDGEIFCWWKKCEHRKWGKEALKSRKQKISHATRRQMRKKSSDKFKMIKFIPKKVLSFPQHLPAILHFDYNSNETQTGAAAGPLSVKSQRINSMKAEISYQHGPSLPNNVFFDDSSITETDQTSSAQENKNKIKRPGGLDGGGEEENSKLNLFRQESLINGNGTFVENENQMNYPDNELPKREHSSGNHNIIGGGTNTQELDDKGSFESQQKQEPEKIQFVDVPLAKHYIITSSGSIENTDILASENVLSQFRNGFKVVSSSPSVESSIGNGEGTSLHRESAADAVEGAEADGGGGGGGSLRTRFSSSEPMEGPSNPAIVPESPQPPAPQSASPYKVSQQIAASTSTTDMSPPVPTYTAQQECVVMGISYKIGTILPQETGNCLQCICIEGASENDSPRVTCSPHNCPPLILPDLFDTTGY